MFAFQSPFICSNRAALSQFSWISAYAILAVDDANVALEPDESRRHRQGVEFLPLAIKFE